MRYLLGRIFEAIKLPGLVRPFRFYDNETGQMISISTSRFYTKLTVGSNEFYFNRETGKPDGFTLLQSSDTVLRIDCKADYTAE